MVALVVLLAWVAGVASVPAGASPAATVKVWFLRGEQMAAVDRPGSTAEGAIRALLSGPTAQEAKQASGPTSRSGPRSGA